MLKTIKARRWNRARPKGPKAGFIPPVIFVGERERVYSLWVTFVAFLGQVLTR